MPDQLSEGIKDNYYKNKYFNYLTLATQYAAISHVLIYQQTLCDLQKNKAIKH